MKIIITGTPGVGKSTVAELLAKRLHLKLYKEKDIVVGTKKGDEVVADLEKLEKFFKDKDDFVAEGHLLCEISIPKAKVFVLRCNPKILWKRLEKRGYSQAKIRDNVECEALDYCTILAEHHYDDVYEIDTTNLTIEQVVEKIIKILKGEQSGDNVDFSEFILELY